MNGLLHPKHGRELMDSHCAFAKVDYSQLNARQKENFNFQKVSGILAEYGFTTIRLTDDWQGADFLAQHIDGVTWLMVQLKSRLTFDKKYFGKNLWICFPYQGTFFLYPHDELLTVVLASSNIGNTDSWQNGGGYSFPVLSVETLQKLEKYRI